MKKMIVLTVTMMIYAAAAAQFCGDLGTVYSPVDFNKDCRVDIEDLAMYAYMWAFPEAEQYYISSIEELHAFSSLSGKTVYMKPGVYTVKGTLPDNQTVFNFTGSDNYFNLKGVTIQIDTSILASMSSDAAHQLATYRVCGNNITFEGGVFENTGNTPPQNSLPEFVLSGDDITFKQCRFIIRGSFPYGYGDMYGKGAGAFVNLKKHSCMSIRGDRCVIEDSYFDIKTFGHAISIHGAQDTVVRNLSIFGALRLTDEIYAETSGTAFDFDFKMMYPEWKQGQPIPLGEMLSLTEDGIRAYLDGEDREGNLRRTGHITVENCYVEKMRGGITLALGGSAAVSGCTVIDSGYTGHAYSLPSNSTVRDCKGSAAFSPLLFLPYSSRESMDIELELLPSDYGMGAHPLALMTGRTYNRIVIHYPCGAPVNQVRPIIVGSAGQRYNETNSTPEELAINHRAAGFAVNNITPYPLELTQYSDGCGIVSVGNVTDSGQDNTVSIVDCQN